MKLVKYTLLLLSLSACSVDVFTADDGGDDQDANQPTHHAMLGRLLADEDSGSTDASPSDTGLDTTNDGGPCSLTPNLHPTCWGGECVTTTPPYLGCTQGTCNPDDWLQCFGITDCSGGTICCAHFGTLTQGCPLKAAMTQAAFCKTGACDSSFSQLCTTSAECLGGKTCKPVADMYWPGLDGSVFGVCE